MHKKIFLFLLLIFKTVSADTDFDYIAVGSSPIMLIEALYKHHLGNRVMIIERADECGGAWKSITICGVPNVDMGCHVAGGNPKMIDFLEKHVGCNMVPMVASQPTSTSYHGNYYPRDGCYELISHLENLIHAAGIPLLMRHSVDQVYIDESRVEAEVIAGGKRFRTKKMLVCHGTELHIANQSPQHTSDRTYPHLYVLVQDQTPDKFIYSGGGSYQGLSIIRISNLSAFCPLRGTDQKIIAFEVRGNLNAQSANQCISFLKSKNLIGPNPRILNFETYTYHQSYLSHGFTSRMSHNGRAVFEYVNTSAIWNISNMASKWEKVFPTYEEAMQN